MSARNRLTCGRRQRALHTRLVLLHQLQQRRRLPCEHGPNDDVQAADCAAHHASLANACQGWCDSAQTTRHATSAAAHAPAAPSALNVRRTPPWQARSRTLHSGLLCGGAGTGAEKRSRRADATALRRWAAAGHARDARQQSGSAAAAGSSASIARAACGGEQRCCCLFSDSDSDSGPGRAGCTARRIAHSSVTRTNAE